MLLQVAWFGDWQAEICKYDRSIDGDMHLYQNINTYLWVYDIHLIYMIFILLYLNFLQRLLYMQGEKKTQPFQKYRMHFLANTLKLEASFWP